MLTHTPRWSHPPGNAVVPSRWQATLGSRGLCLTFPQDVCGHCAEIADMGRLAFAGRRMTEPGEGQRRQCETATSWQITQRSDPSAGAHVRA